MGLIVKFLIIALIIGVIFTSAFYIGFFSLLGGTITEAKVAIEFIPLEIRAILFMVIFGLMIALGKSFFN